MTEQIVRDITKDMLEAFAAEVLQLLKETPSTTARVLALCGDLGAGKTTFTQALGRCLSVTADITSPTFTIMKGYETSDDTVSRLVHMDAYRIDDEDELRPLRFAEILSDPNAIVVIEWAERIKNVLPVGTLQLTLSVKDENTRTATLSRL